MTHSKSTKLVMSTLFDKYFSGVYSPVMKTLDAVQHFGSRRAIADVLGISRQAVYAWGQYVARGAAYRLQVMTAGKLVVDEAKYKRRKK